MMCDGTNASPIRSIRFHMIGADCKLSPEFAELAEEDEQLFELIVHPVYRFIGSVYTRPAPRSRTSNLKPSPGPN